MSPLKSQYRVQKVTLRFLPLAGLVSVEGRHQRPIPSPDIVILNGRIIHTDVAEACRERAYIKEMYKERSSYIALCGEFLDALPFACKERDIKAR
jgi:hypothetical protein